MMHGSLDKQTEVAASQTSEPAADERQQAQDQAVHQRTSMAQGRAEFGGAAQVPQTTPWPQPIPVAITASTLRVRSAPDTSSSDTIVGRLHNGERVDTLGKQGDWLLVDHKGRRAFIHGRYTKPVEAAPKAAAAPPQQEAAPAPAVSPEVTAQPQQQAASPEAAQAMLAGMQAIGVSLMAAMQWLANIAPSCSDEEAGKQDAPPIPQGPQGPQQQDVDAPVNQGSDPIKQEQPKAPVVVPAGAAPLRDKEAAAFLAGLGNQQVNAAAHGVATLETKFAALEDSQSQNEETGGGRDELVSEIGSVRGLIAAIDGAGLDAATAAQAKGRLYRAVQAINPYYSQGRNIDVLETAGATRTCNLTSLAMALESIGIDANAYSGNRTKVLAAAKCSPYAPRVSGAKHKVKEGGDWGRMAGLRLPDFLQLAAIAECASGTSEAAILAGAGEAWDKILSLYFLKTLASRFGVAGSVKAFTTDTGQSKADSKKDLGALSGFGKKHRKDVEKLADARNKAEASGSAKDQAAYEKLLSQEQGAMDGQGVESKLSIEDYKNAIIEQVGADLDSGKGVVVSISGHYVRLQSIHDTHVIVDDPGQTKRADRKVLWEEARAMGYFRHRLLLGG